MGDSNPAATFGYVAQELGKRRIAFIFARESQAAPRLGPALKSAFGGVYIANEGLTRDTAEALINAGEADAVAFGKDFIANPDLPLRLLKQAPLNPARPESFHGYGLSDPVTGYTDYPTLEQAERASR